MNTITLTPQAEARLRAETVRAYDAAAVRIAFGAASQRSASETLLREGRENALCAVAACQGGLSMVYWLGQIDNTERAGIEGRLNMAIRHIQDGEWDRAENSIQIAGRRLLALLRK